MFVDKALSLAVLPCEEDFLKMDYLLVFVPSSYFAILILVELLTIAV
jgi:hypothetical protein